MLYLYESNKASELIKFLSKSITDTESSLSDPLNESFNKSFYKHSFLVPGFGVEQWILKSLSKQFGVFLNGQFLFTRNFVETLTSKLHLPESNLFDRNVISLNLYKILEEEFQKISKTTTSKTTNSLLLPQKYFSYISNTEGGENQSTYLFNLCIELAKIFDDYQWQRPDFLYKWQSSTETQIKEYSNPNEQWQATIWKTLFNLYRSDINIPISERNYIIVEKLQKKVDKCQLNWAGEKLHVFGMVPLFPSLWNILTALSNHIDVAFYWLNPSQHPWSEKLFSPVIEDLISQNYSLEEKHEYFHLHHPLLMNLGQVGADVQSLLMETIDSTPLESFDTFNSMPENSLLNLLKNSLLDDQPEIPNWKNIDLESDNSLTIHSFPDCLTELYTLKQNIHNWLLNSKTSNSNLSDVFILAPNIELYQYLIPIVFNDVEFNAPFTHNKYHSFKESFNALINLLLGNCHLYELKDFFRYTNVQNHLKLSQEEILFFLDKLENLGFYSGVLDIEQKKSKNSFSLQSTIHRLYKQSTCSNIPIQWSTVKVFCDYLTQLVKIKNRVRKNHTVTEWVDLINSQILFLLKDNPDDKLSIIEKKQITFFLDRLKNTTGCENVNLNFNNLNLILQEYNSESRPQTNYINGKLTFSNLLELRSIPVKHIAVIGLNESFPSFPHDSSLTLIKNKRRKGDRCSLSDNQYQILECLLSAQTNLWLSYSEEENTQPSTVINLITDYLLNAGINKSFLPQQHEHIKKPLNEIHTSNKDIKKHKKTNLPNPPNKVFHVKHLSKKISTPIEIYLKEHLVTQRHFLKDEIKIEKVKPDYLTQNKILKEYIQEILLQENKSETNDASDNSINIFSSNNLITNTTNTPHYLNREYAERELQNLIKELHKNKSFNSLLNKNKEWSILKTPKTTKIKDITFIYTPCLTSQNSQLFTSPLNFTIEVFIESKISHLLSNLKSPTSTLYFFSKNKNKKETEPFLFNYTTPETALKKLKIIISFLDLFIEENIVVNKNTLNEKFTSNNPDVIKKSFLESQKRNIQYLNIDSEISFNNSLNDLLLISEVLFTDE